MYCTQCGNQLGERDVFCSQCAHPTGAAHPVRLVEHRLARDMQNKKIAGVCAGFGRYLGIDPVLIRIIWLALVFGAGVGLFAYFIAWIIMPKDETCVAVPSRDYARQY